MRAENKEGENVVLLLINNYMENKGSRESVGSTVTGLRTRRSEVRILTETIDLSLFSEGSLRHGLHPASYSVNNGFFFPAVMRLKQEAEHARTFSTEVCNEWSYTSNPPTASWRV